MKKSIKIIGVIFIIIIVVLIVRRIYYANIEIKPNDLYLSKENSEDNIKMNVRLVDCVGYIVPSSLGYFENEEATKNIMRKHADGKGGEQSRRICRTDPFPQAFP